MTSGRIYREDSLEQRRDVNVLYGHSEGPPRLTCTEIYKQGRDVPGAGKTCLTPGPCDLR